MKNKRYNETFIELAGQPCVVYLVKAKHGRSGTEFFVPKISRIKKEKAWKVKEELK